MWFVLSKGFLTSLKKEDWLVLYQEIFFDLAIAVLPAFPPFFETFSVLTGIATEIPFFVIT